LRRNETRGASPKNSIQASRLHGKKNRGAFSPTSLGLEGSACGPGPRPRGPAIREKVGPAGQQRRLSTRRGALVPGQGFRSKGGRAASKGKPRLLPVGGQAGAESLGRIQGGAADNSNQHFSNFGAPRGPAGPRPLDSAFAFHFRAGSCEFSFRGPGGIQARH